MSELLPYLLILSPLVGAIVTAVIVRFDADQLRPTAIANVICTLLLLSSALGQYELERSTEANARILSDQDGTGTATDIALRQSRHRKLDRIRAEYLSYRWLMIDGLNLWPVVVFALVIAGLLWQASTYRLFSPGFVPWLLFFQSAIFGTLMANDVRAFLISFELSVIVMTILIGRWGGTDRRTLATQFLLFQFAGHLFVALGLAMTMVGVPWLKIDESTTTPIIIYKVSSISFEIQTWVTNNQLAFQYVQEVFPSVILTLCLGFAIHSGFFPFHSSMTSIISRSPVQISLLYITGFSATAYASWYRLVFPIAPDVLVRFDRMMLIALLAGPIWALICCLIRKSFRDRVALAFLGLTSLSLLGPYSMSLVGLCEGWLLQQQSAILVSLILTIAHSPPLPGKQHSEEVSAAPNGLQSIQIALMCVTLVGFFASGSGLLTELLRDNIELSGLIVILIVAMLILVASLFAQSPSFGKSVSSTSTPAPGFSNRIILYLMLLMAVIVNLVPQLMLMQCEPEFARTFRQFEKISPASSARHHSDLRQTPPHMP